tara:strand:- start:884 stop:1066 length:183 start_codon:yes stop_codon:yes gene_type:complete
MTNMGNELIRTDSTSLGYIPYKKTVGTILSPLGRIRRIERLDIETANEYKKYLYDSNKLF